MSDAKAIKRQLTIKTGVVKRLTKEVKTYVQEAQEQEERVARFEREEKEEWEIKQQRKVLADCQQMIPDCQKRLQQAADELQSIVDGLADGGTGADEADIATSDEAQAAKTALEAVQL